ncbi:MAG TPA: hypothetical protein VHW00_01540 [Thermoanaerobaculia bacterium]|nr:hypothetical protein [Thermoanaerobaculia bacterium]
MKKTLLIALLTLSFSTFAQTFSPGGPLAVFDANGDRVGEYLAPGQISVIVNGRQTIISANRLRLYSATSDLYFAQAGCQETAFINAPAELLHNPASFAPDGRVFVATSRTTSSQNVASYFDNVANACVNGASTINNALPTEAGPNLTAQFTAPFSLGPSPAAALATPSAPMNSTVVLGAIVALLALFAVFRLR